MPASASCLFEFADDIPIEEVEATFRLALMATESLYGPDRVAVEAVYRVDLANRAIDVDRSTDVGSTLALLFLGYVRREVGPGGFRMKRIHAPAVAGGEGAQ